MSKRSDLLKIANELGLEFKKNISSVKLAVMIAESKGEPKPIVETAPKSPKIKEQEVTQNINLLKKQRRHKVITDAKIAAFRTKIVTITNKDNRENDVMTTVYLSFENQHFGLSKLVPLDIPVELEVSLISIAEGSMMTLHKDEIVGGRRTGNKVPTRTKKFAISYSQQQ